MNMSRPKDMSRPNLKLTKRPTPAAEMGSQKDAKTGRFLPGNSGFGGRPKGARSKLTTEFFEDFYAIWQKHGADALKKVAEASPKDFVKAAAILMPKELELKSPLADLSDAELADLIVAVRTLVDASATGAAAGRAQAASKPH